MAQLESVTPDLMSIVSRQITPEMIGQMASQLGEDRAKTTSALSTSVPSVLTALSDVASSDAGAAHLKETIDETRHARAGEFGDVASLMRSGAGPTATNGRHGSPATFIEDELGPRSASIVDAVASTSGIKKESARKILGGVTSVAVAAIGKTMGGSGSSSLRSMLGAQRAEWMRKLPGPVASLFSGNGSSSTPVRPNQVLERAPERAHAVERVSTGPAIKELPPPPSRRRWLIPTMAAVVLALLIIPRLRRSAPPPEVPQVTRTEPRAPAPQPAAPAPVETTAPPVAAAPAAAPEPAPAAAEPVAASSLRALGAFLTGTEGTTPRRFALAPLSFGLGATEPTPRSMHTIDELANLLNASPAAKIRVESYTDNVGAADESLRISTARSEAIRSLLAARGVDAARIETVGMGQEQPVASNDTAAGRAQNLRTDVIVTSR